MSSRDFAKRLGAGAAGLGASGLCIAAVQAANFQLFPPPPGLDPEVAGDLERIMAAMPFAAFLVLELSYALGSFAGGWVATWLAPSRPTRVAVGLGIALTLLGAANLAAVPHPPWVAVLTTVTYLPLCLLGASVRARGGKSVAAPVR